jgi:hypothetical protein
MRFALVSGEGACRVSFCNSLYFTTVKYARRTEAENGKKSRLEELIFFALLSTPNNKGKPSSIRKRLDRLKRSALRCNMLHQCARDHGRAKRIAVFSLWRRHLKLVTTEKSDATFQLAFKAPVRCNLSVNNGMQFNVDSAYALRRGRLTATATPPSFEDRA